MHNFDPDLSLNENMNLSPLRRRSELLHTSKSYEYLMLIMHCLRNDVVFSLMHPRTNYVRISAHYNEIQCQIGG